MTTWFLRVASTDGSMAPQKWSTRPPVEKGRLVTSSGNRRATDPVELRPDEEDLPLTLLERIYT